MDLSGATPSGTATPGRHEPSAPGAPWSTDRPALVLPVRGPWQPAVALRSLAAHDVPGSTVTDPAAGRHTRILVGPDGPRAVEVTLLPRVVEVRATHGPWPGLAATVSRWFRLDADTGPAEAHLAADPLLAPLVGARPGLRPLGHPEPFEAAVTAVLGQQVSLAAARTFAGRLVAAYGSPGPAGLRTFPDAETLAAHDVGELRAALGVTGARARTLEGLARSVADGLDLRLARREDLLALPGVGPWTADVLALRLGADDVVCAGDLVLRRALDLPDARAVERRAAGWSPYRSTALWHLWAAAVYT